MKRNTVKRRLGQRLLSMALGMALFAQTMPLTTLTAYAEEQPGMAVEMAQPTEEVLAETAPETEPQAPAEGETGAEAPEETAPDQPTDPEEMPEAPEEIPAEPETESEAPAAPPAAAEGTVKVSSAEQLVGGVPAGSTYMLTQDIEMGAGQQIGLVAGVLDGAGHTITLAGKTLIQELTGTIQNLVVAGEANLQDGQASMVNKVSGGTIQNCASTVKIDPGFSFSLGGIAGKVEGGKIYNSFFAGSARDDFGLPTDYGILHSSNNAEAPTTVKNCYYADGNGVGSGFAWNKDDPSNGQKSLDEMKTPDFVQLLNATNVGSGYIWAAVEGELPKLVPGGGEIVHSDKAALETVIQQANRKNETDYTSDSWASMQKALADAQKVWEQIDATQDAVDQAEKALRDALAALEEKVRELTPVEPPKNGVIAIASQADLEEIRSDANQFYQLTQDLVIEGNYRSPSLAGVLDGNGHTITIRTASPLLDRIVETGVVQNLHIKVEGNFTNRQEFAPFADHLQGGMIVNCISEVTGQHSTGYVRKMEGGEMVNCLTMGHNRRGAFVFFQKSTDHRNTNGYKSGKFYNCYWSASNSVENITPAENLVDCAPVGDETLRSDEFLAKLNGQKGKFGASWGRDENGYPSFGKDHGDHVIDGSKNRYPVQFVWHDKQVTQVEAGNLLLSPQMTDGSRFAGTFQLEGVPQGSTITWSCDDRTNQEIMQMDETGRLHIYHDGGAIVRAMEHKADGSQELAAEIRVVSASREIREMRLLMGGKVIGDSLTVQGAEVCTLEVQVKYADSETFTTLPSYLVELKAEKPDLLITDYNSTIFRFETPGTSKLTVTEKTHKQNPVSVTVAVTSAYVPVKAVKPDISGTVKIHYRNSMGSGQFITVPVTVQVEPSNASYRGQIAVSSGDPAIAQYEGGGYTPYKNGTVTFTAKLNDRGNVVEGSSTVTFEYVNPLAEVSAPNAPLVLEQGTKQTLPLTFHGQPGNRHEITEPDLVWTFDKQGIVSIQRPDALMQVRETGGPDDGNWVASTKFEVKALRPGTVVATGTPVDTTGGAKPVQLTITVTGDGGEVQGFDIPRFIETGKQAATNYLTAHNTFAFGEEWSILTLLRAGQTLPQQKLEGYYQDVATNVRSWKAHVLATEVERVAVALNVMGKDITNVEGVNLAELICNHPELTKQGSNALVWALIALDMQNTPIPAGMKWNREKLVNELLSYQNPDGGFGLDKTGTSGLDMTAMSIQALARYQNRADVATALEKAVNYLASATEKNLNLGNAESISQVILALAVMQRDVVAEPGFGDEMENILSALSEYMVAGEGFRHDKNGKVDKMATTQALQALCAYERFLKGESSYWDLQGTGPVEDPAASVSSQIAALPEKITLADAQAVQAARDAYSTLSESQQNRVTNLAKLEQAEKALAELKAVQQVMDSIAALPEEITLAQGDAVKLCREAYNRLTPAQQAQVSNVKKLEAAEETLRHLASVDRVIQMIDALPEEITLANADAVQAARAAYQLLTAAQQAQVTNKNKLEAAETQLATLLSDQKVQQVEKMIDALPETVTPADVKTVQAARDAYKALTEQQQAQVRNLSKLEQAEQAITNQNAAREVEKRIQALPDVVSMADKQAVQDARSAYEALHADQKPLVKNLAKLEQAEQALENQEAAQKVMAMIQDLPVKITAADETAVQAARDAYKALTEAQQKLVWNLYILERAEQAVEEAKAVQAVEDAIEALPETVTPENANAIKEARAAYNRLAAALRQRVKNLDKLTRAEKQLRELYQPADKTSGGKTVTESNVVKATVQDGMISAKQLAAVQGKDLILRAQGTMETGDRYVLSIYGKDIATAQAFAVGLQRKSLSEEEIHLLSEEPEIFHLVQEGAFPGPVMVEMDTTLADGEYLLLRYDPAQQRAVLISRVQAQNGRVQCIVQEGGDYFLAKKASKKSIPELEEAAAQTAEAVQPEESQPENEDAAKETMQTVEDTQPAPEKTNGTLVWIWLPGLILIAGGVVIARKKRKENEGE